MVYILHSERLSFRKLEQGDAEFIIGLLNSPGWIKYIGDRNVHNTTQAIDYLEKGPMKSYHDNSYGLWLVVIRENETPIGMCGLLKRDYLEHPDIGFALMPEFIGKGYGQEMAMAVFKYARQELNLEQIMAITLPENKASIRVLETLGMCFVKTVESNNGTDEHLLLFASST